MKLQGQTKDLLWFLVVSTIIFALGSIPYWAGRYAETEDLLFRGIYFDETDYAVHISMMQAGHAGEWAYQMRFTSEEHTPAYIRLFYILLGHSSRWLNLKVETTFHLARWIFGAGALFSIYRLCLRAFQERASARAAFLLSVLGSGLGWLQLMLRVPMEPISPVDFWLIDAYVLFSINLFPSFSFTLILMTGALNLYLTFLAQENWRTVFAASLLSVICQMINPIAFAVVDLAVMGAFLFECWKARSILWKPLLALAFIGLSQIPLLAYNFLVLRHDPVWSQFTFQNQTLSPPPMFYLYGFAPFWIFAIPGMISAFRRQNTLLVSMCAWVTGGFLLAYLPVFIQRRFLLGITIPLGILAIEGLNSLIRFLSARWQNIKSRERLLYLAYISAASISSMYLLLGLSMHLQTRPSSKFYPRDLENAFIWLDQNAQTDQFTLGAVPTGQLVAQRTGLKTYVGHEMETLYFENKQAAMEAYYKGITSTDWIVQTPIEWVLYGPYEREVSPAFKPGPELELLFENDQVMIYRITR